MSSSDAGGDKTNQVVKQNAFPIDLAQKIALVKPTDSKGATVQHQFRTLTQQPMRVVMPAGTVQTSGTAQIIQTHLMPQAMLKQGRTQISALPSRTMAQTSLTVTRPLTPNSFMPRGVTTVTNISAPRGAIRAQTPPTVTTVTNISSGFVRGSIPPRTPSPAGTVLPSGTTWMAGSQPVQLIRASIGHSPRTRIVSQNIPTAATVSSSNSGITTISANIVSSQGGQSTQQASNAIQAVNANNSSGQAFVATLGTVLPPRQQTATLVYSNVNNPQQFGASTGQRLAVANPISGPRPVRPILGNARLPTTGLGVRVSSSNISIRGPNIPVLAPPNVLTSLPAGGTTTVSTSNLTAVAGLPRIIQVQQQPTGSTTQVLSAGRISNLMTLHPLVMNSTNANSNIRGTATTAKVQPSLTITHVGKMPTPNVNTTQAGVQIATANLSQGATITATLPTSTANIVQQNQHSNTSTPIGIVMGSNASQSGGQPHQIAQIVNLNQSSVNVGHGHQIQIIGSQQQGSSTVVPLTITPRTVNNSISGTVNTSSAIGQPIASVAQIVRSNVNVVTSVPNSQSNNNNSNSLTGPGSTNSISNIQSTTLPVAKVLPQQQSQSNVVMNDGSMPSIVTVPATVSGVTGQNVFIHSRSPSSVTVTATPVIANNNSTNLHLPSNSQNALSFISSASGAYYIPTTVHSNSNSSNSVGVTAVSSSAVIQSITTTTASLTTNASASTTTCQIISSAPVTSLAYAPQAGSFAVVPATNRNSNQIHALTSASNVQTNQSNPVRFNPQLIVDGSNNQTIQSNTIITMHQQSQLTHPSSHMLATVTGAKVPVQSPRTTTIISSNTSRKRDHNDTFNPATVASIKSAVKNLNPTLLSMSSEQPPRSTTPDSTDGSTTVSATSSPGLDQQEQEELNAMSALHHQNRSIRDDLQFRNVDTHLSHSKLKNHQHIQPITSTVTTASVTQQRNISFPSQPISTNRNNSNGNKEEITPRKRPRKQQFANNSPSAKKFAVISDSNIVPVPMPSTSNSRPSGNSTASISGSENGAQSKPLTVNKVNKDLRKSVEFYVKKPRTISLLSSYKATWKANINHFQRYSDVKPREERPPTVMDLANQAQVLQRVNGWKVYHLTSQMEDLSELESRVYERLSSMLQVMEAHDQTTDVERVNELIKGNMQRSKIVADSINEARVQIFKVFDHKSPVSELIHRCASKRNFKKRDKV